MIDPLVPLVPSDFGETSIVVDEHRPVAALVTGSDIRFVTWPDAPLPDGESETSLPWPRDTTTTSTTPS